jgi:hypothetical protein
VVYLTVVRKPINQYLIENSKTCDVTYDRIIELEDEGKNIALPLGSESHLTESIETRKRKRDHSNELDLKHAFRRLTLMSKAPCLDATVSVVDEMPFPFKATQEIPSDIAMTDCSDSTGEAADIENFGPINDDLIMFDWPEREEAMGPVNMAIEAPTLKDAIYQVPELVQINQYKSELPQRPPNPSIPPRIVKIWSCVSSNAFRKPIKTNFISG